MRTNRTHRILELTKLFLEGKTSLEDSKAAYREKGWNVSVRTIYSDRVAALKGFKSELDEKRSSLFAMGMQRLEDLYAVAYASGDVKRCLDVLKEINRLIGL